MPCRWPRPGCSPIRDRPNAESGGCVAGSAPWALAHPDPQQAVACVQGVGAHAGARGYLFHAGHFDAAAAAIESQAVVTAFKVVALDAAQRERQLAVRAGVFQGGRAAVGLAVEHDVFAQHAHGQGLVAELPVPRGDVPGVAQKHGAGSNQTGVNPEVRGTSQWLQKARVPV